MLLTASLKIRNTCRRMSAPIRRSGCAAVARNSKAMLRAVKTSVAKRRIRCSRLLRWSCLGLMGQTMSLMESTSSLDTAAMSESGPAAWRSGGIYPSSPRRWSPSTFRRLSFWSTCDAGSSAYSGRTRGWSGYTPF